MPCLLFSTDRECLVFQMCWTNSVNILSKAVGKSIEKYLKGFKFPLHFIVYQKKLLEKIRDVHFGLFCSQYFKLLVMLLECKSHDIMWTITSKSIAPKELTQV